MSGKNLVSSFIKFGSKHRMEQLLNSGTICMNRLSFYRECEDKEMGDPHEGTLYTCPSSKTKWVLDGTYIQNDAPTGSAKMTNKTYNPFIYCMYGVYIKEGESFKNRIEYDERLLSFGNTAVIIYKPQIFIERILKKHTEMQFDKVKYVDENSYSGDMGCFMKYDNYSHQEEMRIAYFDKSLLETQLIFDIGSIKDIARIEHI